MLEFIQAAHKNQAREANMDLDEMSQLCVSSGWA